MAKTDAGVQGHTELLIDEAGVEARLKVELDPAGSQWSAADVVKLLEERGVREGYDIEDIRRRLAEAKRAGKSPVELVVAEGLAPEHPQPERFRADEHPVPESLQPQARRSVAEAGPPEIVFHRKKRVKRKKTVTRKPKLPLGSPKQETVEVTETTTVPERVHVDPTVERTGYVDEGERIGTIAPQETGMPGRSIFGEVLQPKVPADPHIYLGRGTVRRGDEVYAEETGFLRLGANWLDVVPYRLHEWNLEVSEDRATCFLFFRPGESSHEPPTGATILEAAAEHGFEADTLLPEEEIDELIRHAVDTDVPVEGVPITVSRDAGFDIVVSEDKLKAMLNVSKGRGRGKALDMKALGQALRESRLKGLDLERIREDLNAFYKGSETDLYGYVLTQGTAPVPGPDREVEWSVRFLADERAEAIERRARENPEFLAGLRSLSEFPVSEVTRVAFVQRDQRVAALPPEVSGTPGVDVYGASIPAPGGNAPELKLYENLTRKDNVIVATESGLFEEATSEEDGVIRIRVRPHHDAEIRVEISGDKMQAFLSLSEGEGTGRRLSVEEARKAVEDAGVSYGIDADAVREAVTHAKEEGPVFRAVVARGSEPESPLRPKPEFLVRVASGQAFTVKSDGRVDYKHHDRMTIVRKGTEIVRIPPPPEEPAPGTDVTGGEIPPPKGSEVELTLGDNVSARTEDDGSTLVTAAVSGELLTQHSMVAVRPAYSIKGNVGVATGNIKFPGSVYIQGGVDAGYYVFADGDIRVGEAAEACLLSAEGDILLKQGVKGAGKAALRAKGRIAVAFAELATLLAVGDISVKTGCMHSTLKSNGMIRASADRGSIVGGRIRARKGMEVRNLGSSREVATEVSFGQDYLIADRIEKEEKQIEELKRRITKDDLEMREAASDRSRLEELRRDKKKMLKMIEQRSVRLFNLREKFEEHFPAEIRVHGTVFPGVKIESHGRTIEFTAPEKGVVISFDETTGRLVRTSLSKVESQREPAR
ncbi:MAG: flagellar assembly protein A [Spirochaetaceae bacterium]